jgi:hypothetical protein
MKTFQQFINSRSPVKEPKKKAYKPVGPMIDIMINPDKKGQTIDTKA